MTKRQGWLLPTEGARQARSSSWSSSSSVDGIAAKAPHVAAPRNQVAQADAEFGIELGHVEFGHCAHSRWKLLGARVSLSPGLVKTGLARRLVDLHRALFDRFGGRDGLIALHALWHRAQHQQQEPDSAGQQ